eukprot:CAMPEP_0172781034 /NCGR_PEP_ID=MMETSP1074-20121228/203228_1 /TAXON_ID=2916 /ORGANISM="Ceratium fusus, Strain PA161109" /LENGTH=33 /DNA_ID= /DNA_START= /DNA_END= /DNA_ORIENTATION=
MGVATRQLQGDVCVAKTEFRVFEFAVRVDNAEA